MILLHQLGKQGVELPLVNLVIVMHDLSFEEIISSSYKPWKICQPFTTTDSHTTEKMIPTHFHSFVTMAVGVSTQR